MQTKLFKPGYVLLAVLAGMFLCGGVFAAAKKIIYFTGNAVPSTAEKAAISALNAQAAQQYKVVVRNSRKAVARESADYIAGSAIPPVYRDGGVDVGTPLYTEFDPNYPPAPPSLPTRQHVFSNGDYVHITNVAGVPSVRLTISGGAITGAVYIGPDAGS